MRFCLTENTEFFFIFLRGLREARKALVISVVNDGLTHELAPSKKSGITPIKRGKVGKVLQKAGFIGKLLDYHITREANEPTRAILPES